MKAILCTYIAGVIAAATAGFLSPAPWTGMLAIAAGCIWAAYDLLEVEDPNGNIETTSSKKRRRS